MLVLDPTHSRVARQRAYRRWIRAAETRGPAALRDTQRTLARRDLFYLLTELLERRDLDHDWLYARCHEVQAAPDGHLDLWAREHGKTSIISFGKTIQDIVADPEITVGIFSHTRRSAKAILRQIRRELERNEALKALFDDVLWDKPRRQAPQWSDEDGIVVRRRANPKEATVEAWGLIDGLPTGKHFRLRIYDELADAWPDIEPLVALACARSSGKITTPDVARDLARGAIHLWAGITADHPRPVKVILIGQFVEYPRLRSFRPFAVVGDDLATWIDLLPAIERWAQANGARLIEPLGRPGWERVLRARGYKKTHVLMEKALP